jgi:hypothetical protein
MRQSLFTLICAAALTAGCGEATDKFDDAFDKNFSSSCVSSATQGGVPSDIATKACDCSLAKINEQYSTTEKLTLSGEKAQPIMVECLNRAIPHIPPPSPAAS